MEKRTVMITKFKDFLKRSIALGDTVVVQDGSSVGVGRASHITAAGNLIIKERLGYAGGIYSRTMSHYYSEAKVVISNDPELVAYTQDIKIKGEV